MSSLRCSFEVRTPYISEAAWKANYRKAREIKDYLGFKGCSFIVFNESATEPGRIDFSYDPNNIPSFKTNLAIEHLNRAFPELTFDCFQLFNRFSNTEDYK
jgi:hypothetical protein